MSVGVTSRARPRWLHVHTVVEPTTSPIRGWGYLVSNMLRKSFHFRIAVN